MYFASNLEHVVSMLHPFSYGCTRFGPTSSAPAAGEERGVVILRDRCGSLRQLIDTTPPHTGATGVAEPRDLLAQGNRIGKVKNRATMFAYLKCVCPRGHGLISGWDILAGRGVSSAPQLSAPSTSPEQQTTRLKRRPG